MALLNWRLPWNCISTVLFELGQLESPVVPATLKTRVIGLWNLLHHTDWHCSPVYQRHLPGPFPLHAILLFHCVYLGDLWGHPELHRHRGADSADNGRKPDWIGTSTSVALWCFQRRNLWSCVHAFKLTILAIRLWSSASRQLWQTPAERHGDAFGASASTSSRPHTAAHAIHHGTSVWISTMYMDRRRRARNQVPLPDPNRESSGNNRKTGRIGANHPEEEAMPLNTDKQNRRGNGQRLRRRSSPKTAMARRHWIHHGNQRHLQHCLRHQWSLRVPQQNGRCFRSLFMP